MIKAVLIWISDAIFLTILYYGFEKRDPSLVGDFHHQCWGPTQWLQHTKTNFRTKSHKTCKKEEIIFSTLFLKLWSIRSNLSCKPQKPLLSMLVESQPLLTWFTALMRSVTCTSESHLSVDESLILIYQSRKCQSGNMYSTYSNCFLKTTLRSHK